MTLIYEFSESDGITYGYTWYLPILGFSSKEELGIHILEQIKSCQGPLINIGNREFYKDTLLEKGEDVMNRIFTLEEWIDNEGITR